MNKMPIDAERRTELELGVSVVNYYSAESIERLVRSLVKFSGSRSTIVSIVDNSVDRPHAEYERLLRIADSYSSHSFQIHVIRSSLNLGYAAGNNLATSYLLDRGVGLIWVLNPDTLVQGHVHALLEDVAKSSCGVWSTLTVEHGTKGFGLGTLSTITGSGGTGSKPQYGNRTFSFEYPAGHSILFRRSAWLMLSGFDERYFLFMEEADLTLRAHKFGISMGILSSVTVEHDQGLTTGSTRDLASKSVTSYREATRSRVLFFRRFYPWRIPVLMASRVAYAVLVHLSGSSAGSRAVLDGLRSGMKRQIDEKGYDQS